MGLARLRRAIIDNFMEQDQRERRRRRAASRGEDDTRAASIARVLGERIIRGELAPGTALRQEAVARDFDASHVPVREAFRRLEAQGLLERLPRRGVRVAAASAAELREIAEMRALLESLALRHAAPHLTPEILAAAEAASREAEQAADVAAFEAANRRFHRLLLEPCGMRRLLAVIDDLLLASARFLFLGWQPRWEAGSERDHRAILAALRAGEVESACALLARHVRAMAAGAGGSGEGERRASRLRVG